MQPQAKAYVICSRDLVSSNRIEQDLHKAVGLHSVNHNIVNHANSYSVTVNYSDQNISRPVSKQACHAPLMHSTYLDYVWEIKVLL